MRGSSKKPIIYTSVLLFSVLCLLFSVFCSLSYSAVPHLINYQGRLTDKVGKPLDGAHQITFRIYDAPAAGNLLWEETYSALLIQKGIFNVMLGSVGSLNLAFDRPYYLEIKVGNEVMAPRQQIASAGYALRAETADNAAAVNGIGVSASPSPNKTLALDTNAKLPAAALKSYDSGWFAVVKNRVYVKAHNLGTVRFLASIYFSATGVDDGSAEQDNYSPSPLGYNGMQVEGITTTQVTMRTGQNKVHQSMGGVEYDSGYARIIVLPLE